MYIVPKFYWYGKRGYVTAKMSKRVGMERFITMAALDMQGCINNLQR